MLSHQTAALLLRSVQRSAALAALLLIAGCSVRLANEAGRFVAAGQTPVVSQRGNVLTIGAGRDARSYRSTRDCARHPNTCRTYAFDGVLAPGVYGVRVGYYEGSDYLVVVPGSGEASTGTRPILSPSGRFMTSAITSDAYETDAEGMHIWTVREGTRLVFAVNPDRLRPLYPAYPERLTWLNDGCLKLSVVVGDGPPDTSPRKWLYVSASSTGWQLLEGQSPICTHVQ